MTLSEWTGTEVMSLHLRCSLLVTNKLTYRAACKEFSLCLIEYQTLSST